MKSIEWSPATGEDAGRIFVITRMSAFAADKWARHLVKALIQSGAKLPESVLEAGVMGLAGMAMSLFGYLDDDACDKAFQALIDCVQIKRRPELPAGPLLEVDIQDPQTLTDLRTEAFKLHVGFLKAAASQISPLAAALLGDSNENSPAL